MKIFFLFFFCVSSFFAQAQEQPDSLFQDSVSTSIVKKDFSAPNDSTLVAKRSFDSALVHTLKADPTFNYKQPPTVAESLWDRFLMWIVDIIDSIFRNATGTNLGRIFLYVGGAVLLIALIMLLLKVNAFRVFHSGADQGKSNIMFHENIHEMDFETLIRDATAKGEYRLGVRLIFLFALKTLADKQLIDFQAGKTNHDYVEELNTKELKTGLNELSFYFDYAWYGGFTVNEDIFNKVDSIFKLWKNKMNG